MVRQHLGLCCRSRTSYYSCYWFFRGVKECASTQTGIEGAANLVAPTASTKVEIVHLPHYRNCQSLATIPQRVTEPNLNRDHREYEQMNGCKRINKFNKLLLHYCRILLNLFFTVMAGAAPHCRSISSWIIPGCFNFGIIALSLYRRLERG